MEYEEGDRRKQTNKPNTQNRNRAGGGGRLFFFLPSLYVHILEKNKLQEKRYF